MKAAMRAGEKPRLATIRLIMAAIKQREVDERIELDDVQVLGVIDKMVKQRRESVTQFAAGGRADLVAKEEAELRLLVAYLLLQIHIALKAHTTRVFQIAFAFEIVVRRHLESLHVHHGDIVLVFEVHIEVPLAVADRLLRRAAEIYQNAGRMDAAIRQLDPAAIERYRIA